MITWTLNTPTIQYGTGPVRLLVQGLQPNELFTLLVSNPTEPAFRWSLQATAEGTISEELWLASGPGTYSLAQESGCHELPTLEVLATTCAPPGAGECGLELHLNNLRVSLGGSVTVSVTGAVANQPVTIYRQLGTEFLAFSVVSSPSGVATLVSTPTAEGLCTFLASQGVCTAAGKQVTVLGNSNLLPTATTDPCVGAITVTPQFFSSLVGNGATIALVLTVTNRSAGALVVNLAVPLPPELSSVTGVTLINESISANSTKDFIFYLTALNLGETEILVPFGIAANSGSYMCGGSARAIIGEHTSISISASARPCGVELISFLFSSPTVASGNQAVLTMRVRNIGAAPITNLSLAAIAPPSVLVGGSLQFSGVVVAPGEDYLYSKTFLASTVVATTALLSVPAGQLTAVCQGNTIATLRTATTAIRVNP